MGSSGGEATWLRYVWPSSGACPCLAAADLYYELSANGKQRLQRFTLTVTPALTEQEILAWLGSPRRTVLDQETGHARSHYYDGTDRRGLHVQEVWWEEWLGRLLSVSFDGRPPSPPAAR